MRAGIVSLVLAGGALVACLDLSESEDSRSDAGSDAQAISDGSFPEGSSTGGTSGTGGASTCEEGKRCAPPLPDTTWAGPFYRWQGVGTEPACPKGNPAFSGGVTIDSGTHACACDCVSSISCPATFTAVVYDTPSCGTPCGSTPLNDACVSSVVGCSNPAAFLIQGFNPGVCGTSVKQQLEPASFKDAIVACGTTSEGSCGENRVCVAEALAPFDAQLCIGKPGDVSCSGGYPQKITGHADLTDTRGCSADSCLCLPSGDCGVTSSPCDQSFGVALSPGGTGCLLVGGGGFRLGFPAKPLSCQASGSASKTGGLTPTGTFTLCCEAPTS